MTSKFPENEYAVWNSPDESAKILYPLALFHEIDFVVNEGFRRIPHGGVEVAGLLFGRAENDGSIRIEAFRNIECEHAFGPSFVLSERDLAALGDQMEAAKSDPELAGLAALGWFIAHTRSQLQMNDRELTLFDRFFPGSGKLTILIKPERFQPTRFAFLIREANGTVERDGSERAIILPLPGRASRVGAEPVRSIPAPPEKPALPVSRPAPVTAPPAPSNPSVQPAAEAIPQRAPVSAPPPVQLARSPEPVAKEPTPPIPAESLPTIDEIKRRRASRPEVETNWPAPTAPAVSRPAATEERSNVRLAVVLLLAALLGCAVGYWGYTQLPSPTIVLTVEPEKAGLLVSWPPSETRNSAYAAIRIDDGDPVPLSAEQKSSGQMTIPSTATNVKIELVAQHWMRDSRGIVRYVAAAPAAQATISPSAPAAVTGTH